MDPTPPQSRKRGKGNAVEWAQWGETSSIAIWNRNDSKTEASVPSGRITQTGRLSADLSEYSGYLAVPSCPALAGPPAWTEGGGLPQEPVDRWRVGSERLWWRRGRAECDRDPKGRLMVSAKNAGLPSANCRSDSSRCWTNPSRRPAPRLMAACSMASQEVTPEAQSFCSALIPNLGTWQKVRRSTTQPGTGQTPRQ